MKKKTRPQHIVIVGSYNGTSIGDTAIALGLLCAIQRITPEAKITLLCFGPLGLETDLKHFGIKLNLCIVRINTTAFQDFPLVRSILWRLPAYLKGTSHLNRKRLCQSIADADLMLIGGGNLLMDMFQTGPDILEELVNVAQKQGVPHVFAGVGAGPVRTENGRKKLISLVNGAKALLLRDQGSANTCISKLGVQQAKVAPDFAFALPYVTTASGNRRNALAVNIAGLYSEIWPKKNTGHYRRYIYRMLELSKIVLELFHLERIIVVDTNPAFDGITAMDFSELCRQRGIGRSVELITGINNVSSIVNAFGQARVAITTRLHAGLLAARAGTTVIPIAYQPKVSDVLISSGVAADSIMISNFLAKSPDSAQLNKFKDFSESKLEQLFANAQVSLHESLVELFQMIRLK